MSCSGACVYRCSGWQPRFTGGRVTHSLPDPLPAGSPGAEGIGSLHAGCITVGSSVSFCVAP